MTDVGLQRRDARELERVQRVVEQVPTVDLGEQVLEVVQTRRVDETEEARTVHVGIGGETGVEVGEQRVGRCAVHGERGCVGHSNWAPI